MGKQLTTEQFIEKARLVHGDKYDYSKSVYGGKDKKVCIICPEHGEFWQTPHNHCQGQNCPLCALENKANTTEQFIEAARKIHGDRYDYSMTKYKDSKTKVEIICPVHGVFYQRPDIHLSGSICPVCVREAKMNTLEYYIQLSIEKHGDKYDFSNATYLGATKKIEVRCKNCGNIFFITPSSLIKGRGCKMCNIEEERKLPCLDGEEWRDIIGFDGYQISNMGRIRSVDRTVAVGIHKREIVGLILKANKDKDGYECVTLKAGGKSYRKKVHRLVAETFIDNPNGYPCIDHINGIRDDNRAENLRWCTVKMNANYELAKKNRSSAIKQSYVNNPNLRGIRANTFGKSNMQRVEVFQNEISLGVFDSQIQASRCLGISQSLISQCARTGIKSKNGITVKKI